MTQGEVGPPDEPTDTPFGATAGSASCSETREGECTRILLDLYLKAPQMSDKELYDFVLDTRFPVLTGYMGRRR